MVSSADSNSTEKNGEQNEVRSLNWSLYIIRCADSSLYIGISNDVERRFQDHCNGKGAKYTRGRAPLILVYQYCLGEHSLAARYEYACKQLSKQEKELLVRQQSALEEIIELD